MIPKKYSLQQEAAVASYDYTDIAEGTGTIIFYGFKTDVSGAATYKLTTNSSIYSAVIETESAAAGTTTMNFDSQEFNLPRTVKGTAYANVPFYDKDAAGSAYITAELFVYDGTTATSISDEVTCSKTTGASEGKMVCLPLTLTQTTIKKGEQIRLTIKFIQDANGGQTNYIGHDPKGRDGDNITAANGLSSTLTAHIPFKLDL